MSGPASPILPGATLGVMGGGQLGRMFVIAARVMGYKVVVLDPDPAQDQGPTRGKAMGIDPLSDQHRRPCCWR